MKRVWIAATILLLIFSATLMHSYHIKDLSAQLISLLEAAEKDAEREDWAGAKKLTQTARDKWETQGLYLHITLRHSETDGIHTGFREVAEFIQCQEGGEYSAANSRLISALELLSEAEQLSLQNVL